MMWFCFAMAVFYGVCFVMPAYADVAPELDAGTLSGLVSGIVGTYIAYRAYAVTKRPGSK